MLFAKQVRLQSRFHHVKWASDDRATHTTNTAVHSSMLKLQLSDTYLLTRLLRSAAMTLREASCY